MILDNTHTPPVLRLWANDACHTLALGESVERPVGQTYRDTPASELQRIVAEVIAGTPWRRVVADRYAESFPWLHRIVTDPSRDLFFRLHPPAAHSRILDVGAGWGQIALPLARDGFVCALEPTPERLQFIQAAARQDGLDGRMWFVQADFLEIGFEEAFDLVTCIGVLEWVPKFAPNIDPLEAQRRFLSRIRAVLAPGGRVVIGIENRLGLKYLLGAPDDHIGHPGVSVYDLALADRKWRALSGEPLRAVTHTRAELTDLLRQTGFAAPQFHCAFPDYKLPRTICAWGADTDAFLAENFEEEHEGCAGTRLNTQDELRSHYRSLARLKIASDFAPSFFVSATRE